MQIECLQRYFILSTAIFMMCPKRTYQLKRNNNIVQDTFSYQSTNHGSEKLKMDQSDEPGFNLTEEEMAKFKIWPKGIIPYFIDDFSFDYSMRQKLRLILSNINSLTGLSFTELPVLSDNDKDRVVFFINRRGVLGCQDYTTNNFTNTGVQRLLLGYDCLGEGSGGLAATVLVLVGVPPQHNSPDRDQYIEVNMANIIPEKQQLYQKLKDNEWLFHDVDYDFLSAGHYSFHKYTINGAATIRPKGEVDHFVGEAEGLSTKDIWKIRMLYNFISRNKRKVEISDCSRLFKPGSDFSNFHPAQENNVTPREKSNKYLGHNNKDVLEPNFSHSNSIEGMNAIIDNPVENGIAKLSFKNKKIIGDTDDIKLKGIGQASDYNTDDYK